MEYFVYIIESKKDSSFYIGYTSDLVKRLENHNSGLSTYTSKKIPWKIVYFEKFLNKTFFIPESATGVSIAQFFCCYPRKLNPV